ncbi:MAG: right-handed parallel beta-helix repeat-containing protein, partial [Patescibacteria group bacterium]|nr:right-handed parallel beta-helix repeat-containing protein [Patescibacteria group bacterium]
MEGTNMHTANAHHHQAFFGAVFFVCALLLAHPVEAATDIHGFPSGAGGLMSLDKSPYIVHKSITVNNSFTLTIEPGVILKMRPGVGITIFGGGSAVIGSEGGDTVVITSEKDDEYGGDTNEDGNTSAPGPGDWTRIQAAGDDASVAIHNAVIRYGGFSIPMIQVLSGAQAIITNTTIEQGNNTAIGLRNGDSALTLVDSIIRGHFEGITISLQADATIYGTVFADNRRGIAIDSDADVAHVIITGNTFSNNTRVAGDTPFAGIDFDDEDDVLIAVGNDWGDPSGPAHANNPAGIGDRIFGNVLFDPWTNKPPDNHAPVLSFIDDEGYGDDGVSPDVGFIGQDVPVFKVMYSDADGGDAQYVRLVVGDDAFAMATSSDGMFEFDGALGGFNKGEYTYHFEASDGVDVVRFPADGELAFEMRNVPVILVPGIMGTELWKGYDETLWLDIAEMLAWWLDDFLDPLRMNEDGTPSDSGVVIGDVVRSPKLGLLPVYDYLSGIIDVFQERGYQESNDLFVFPYDWRLDVGDSSKKLEEKIDSIIAQTES